MRKIQVGGLLYVFGENGLPEQILLPDDFDHINFLAEPADIAITLEDGRILHPRADEAADLSFVRKKDFVRVNCQKMSLYDSAGHIEEGFHISVRTDIYDGGAAFTEAFFRSDSCTVPAIRGFVLTYRLALSSFEKIRWSMAYRPKKIDGTLIQTSLPERENKVGDDRFSDPGIFPLAGFCLQRADGPSLYAEFEMDGDNVLGPDPNANCSSVTWKDGDAVLTWNFQKETAKPLIGPWQWRGYWGMIVHPAEKTRRHPPLAMFHYMDNKQLYPCAESLKVMKELGTDVLLLHDCWRLDPQNGGIPFDRKRFNETVEGARAGGMRVMVYMRGSENAETDDETDWFEELLQYNHDGLYMDYGGPFHFSSPPDELFQGGRIHFRRHEKANRRRRQTIGPDGLFFAHTGPMYSALGMTENVLDGYVSGEGERGLMVRSRWDHLCYSMAMVVPGTMWTAAFPEYSSSVMRPFLAATGQSPHVPLGVEMPSSSLAHPEVPGFTDREFRPLWKLWHLLRGAKDLQIRNDYNCRGIFHLSEEVGHYLMSDGHSAVCILSNFAGHPVEADPYVNWQALGFDPAAPKTLCTPTVESPGKARVMREGESVKLEKDGVAAICVNIPDFSDFEKPYPDFSPLALEHLRNIEEQKRLRRGLPPAQEWWIRLRVPELSLAYEASMVWDLYDNRLCLFEEKDGTVVRHGYFAKNGFRRDEPGQEDFIWNGQESIWIPLREILGAGTKHLYIQSLHRGDLYYVNVPFYSFIEADFARTAGKTDYTIRFMNELEDDRSLLHFDLNFI